MISTDPSSRFFGPRSREVPRGPKSPTVIDIVGNNSTVPIRFMLKHDSERGMFFRVGMGTATRRVYLNQVTFLSMPADSSTGRGGFKRKRDS